MKRGILPKTCLLLSGCFLMHTAVQSQVQLPYSSGFDTPTQKAGWQEFRKGAIAFYNWSFLSGSTASGPNYLSHNYPAGASATDTTEDWFVSPMFNLSAGGHISLKVSLYSATGLATPADGLDLYILNGNADPDLATVTLLASFAHLTSGSTVFIDSTDIPLPAMNGHSYIGIRYKATQNMFVTGIDDISITSIANVNNIYNEQVIHVYPNPVGHTLSIETTQPGFKACLYGLNGALLIPQHNNGKMDLSKLEGGLYMLEITLPGGIKTFHRVVKK